MSVLSSDARWKAIVHYRSDTGLVDVEHLLEELDELAEYVEAGPHWDTIERIEIVRINHCTDPDLTIEEANIL